MNEQMFRYKDGLVDIFTLSPNKNYYYKIRKPQSLNPSAFGCKIAFYSINGLLIYHHSKVFTHELHNNKELGEIKEKFLSSNYKFINTPNQPSLEFVKWSLQGNIA